MRDKDTLRASLNLYQIKNHRASFMPVNLVFEVYADKEARELYVFLVIKEA